MTGPDGVAQLYPTKPGGEEWYLSPVPSADARFKPQNPISLNPDGSWKMKSAKVRMEVLTSTGYRTLDTTDRKILAARGYMLAPNDWRNVEMTGFVRLNRASVPSDNFCWYARGGRHTDSAPCEGSSVKGGLHYDGRVRVEKESWHVSYAQAGYLRVTSQLAGRWVGFKVVIVNVRGDVDVEMYVNDPALGDRWVGVYGWIDDGHFGGDATHCGASDPKLPITWGGPIACFRWDNAEDVDFKLLSVREIATDAVPVPGPQPDPTPQPGGNVTVPKIDHFEQVAPDRIVPVTIDGRSAYAFTVRPGDVQEWDKGNIGPGGQPNQRAEISYAPAASSEKGKSPYDITDASGQRIYDIGFKFADGWPMDQRWATLLQFHQEDSKGGSPSGWGFGGISVHGGTMDFAEPKPGGQDIDKFFARIPITTGRWYDIRLEINWASDSSGTIVVRNGGQVAGEYHGPTIPAGMYKYLKQGYYRDGAVAQPGTVYQTPLSITEGAATPAPGPSPTPDPTPAPAPAAGPSAQALAIRDQLVAARDQLQALVAGISAVLDKGPP